MVTQGYVTIDHHQIKKWVHERSGWPAMKASRFTVRESDKVLSIGFTGCENDELLIPISWEEFFKKFDEQNLAFMYEDQDASGYLSLQYKFM
ncbi:MAG: hypothetical protein EHM41_19370 [Chloroflexi bacterium]|nr:MAG: hypothetical protein EHM41_19370 [Chloroflexota bacterium]